LSFRSSVNSSHGATTAIDIELSVVTYCLYTISPLDSELSVVERNLRAASNPGQLAQCAEVRVSLSVEYAIFKEGIFSHWNAF
jgi:hypothetical protein